MKAAITFLIIVSLGMGVALLVRHNKAVQQQKSDFEAKRDLTNQLEATRTKYEEQEKLAMFLQQNLEQRAKELMLKSNDLMKTSAELAKTQKEAQAAAEAAKAEMAKRDAKINELETQRDDLTKKMDDLNINIADLGKMIAVTEQKLAASEGDREFLLKELKRLQTEKAELERQFNDLSVLRTQVAKLKDELTIAKRLDWIRSGLYGQQATKGAEKLMASATPAAVTNFNLNVILKEDGGVSVVPAVSNGTNKVLQPVSQK